MTDKGRKKEKNKLNFPRWKNLVSKNGVLFKIKNIKDHVYQLVFYFTFSFKENDIFLFFDYV